MTICQPKVYLLGRQQVDDVEMERFLKDIGTPDYLTDAASPGEVLVEAGGRVCYLSFANPRPGGMRAYADNILRSDHTSVLEHAVFTIMVTGVSRSLTHELVRHRHASPSQLSQRYVDETKDDGGLEVVMPPLVKQANDLLLQGAKGYLETVCRQVHSQWLRAMKEAEDHYRDMDHWCTELAHLTYGMKAEQEVRQAHADKGPCGTFELADLRAVKTKVRKMARETARSVLPNATETKIQLTLNAQAARHLFYRRGSRHADPEIRNLAVLVFDRLKADSPNLFQDITKLEDGTLSSPLWRDC